MADEHIHWSRRTLLAGAGTAFASLALGNWPRRVAAAGGISWTRLTPSLTLLASASGNMLFHETASGCVLVDTGLANEADDLLETLEELSDQPVVAVFNTHWHADRVGANALLAEQGAAIHAHVKTRQRLASGYYLPDQDAYAPALTPAGVPTETFYDAGTLNVGRDQIEYFHLIEAHTDGDIAVRFPVANVIAIGGVISPDSDPEFDWFGGGWLGGRLDAYERLLENSDQDTRFVPAQGPVISRAELKDEHQMLLELFDRMVEHIRLGQDSRDMLEVGVLDGLGRTFDDPYRLLYDLNKSFWAHHNKLMHDIV